MSTFWKIEEAVGGGRYIVLDGTFSTKESAEAEIAKRLGSQHMRAALYQTGSWRGGPVRVDWREFG